MFWILPSRTFILEAKVDRGIGPNRGRRTKDLKLETRIWYVIPTIPNPCPQKYIYMYRWKEVLYMDSLLVWSWLHPIYPIDQVAGCRMIHINSKFLVFCTYKTDMHAGYAHTASTEVTAYTYYGG